MGTPEDAAAEKYFTPPDERENMVIEAGKTYRVKGQSKYFARKYGSANPEIVIEGKQDYHHFFSPPSFLFQGRALAEGIPIDGNTYYGHIGGLGEFVHESELEEV
ncbi:unnamed protein product [marine sediment metagenome]|uniref:Uncharacterized protein n=1 Tax=marine sediment metagenome TaxID=412755 RepID=X1HUT5_9ZZZZ